MRSPEVYIRLFKKTIFVQKQQIVLKEIAHITTEDTYQQKIENMVIFQIPNKDKKGKYVISIIGIIKTLKDKYPEITVLSVGEMEGVIEYLPSTLAPNKWIEYLKAVTVSIIVFAGASIAIMTYNTDTSLPETFIILNRILTGKEIENPVLITIPYSIGIAVGVLLFFNHVGKLKLTDDPSPMQIEIDKYEEDIENTTIGKIVSEKRGQP